MPTSPYASKVPVTSRRTNAWASVRVRLRVRVRVRARARARVRVRVGAVAGGLGLEG